MRSTIHRTLAVSVLSVLSFYPRAQAGIPVTVPVDSPSLLDGGHAGASPQAEALELFIEAGVLADARKYAEAIGRYRRAQEVDPGAVGISLPMAHAYLEASQVDSARVYATHALGDSTHRAEVFRLLARCDMYEGDADGAADHLRQALAEAPEDEWTLLNLLSILQRRGRPADALALIEPAIPENLATAHVYSRRASLRSQSGRHEDAIRDLVQSLRKDPEYPGTEGAIVQELSRVSDPDEVSEEIESLISEFPGLVELRRGWITALTRAEDWEAVPPHLQAYLVLRPEDGRAHLQAGLLDLRTGKRDAAEAHLLAAAALLANDPEPYRWLWRLEVGRDNWLAALTAADSLLSRSPRNAEGLWFRGLALHETERTNEAAAVLANLLDSAPGHREAALLLSTLLAEREEWAGAAARLGAYLKAEPDDAEALLRHGIVLERGGRFEDAGVSLQALLRIEPTNHVALNYLGYMWLERGERIDEAMALIRRALELDPDNPAYLDSYGWGFFIRAEYAESISHLERAVAQGGDHPEILSHLGQAYEAVGRREDALAQYRKALQLNPEDPALLERVDRLDTSEQRN